MKIIAVSERSFTDTNSVCLLSDRKPGGGEERKGSWELKGLLGKAEGDSKESKRSRCPALPERNVKS